MKRTASLLLSALLCAASFAATAHDFVQPRPGSDPVLARLAAEMEEKMVQIVDEAR